MKKNIRQNMKDSAKVSVNNNTIKNNEQISSPEKSDEESTSFDKNTPEREALFHYLLAEIETHKKEITEQRESIDKLKRLIHVNGVISNSLHRREVLRRIINQTKELMNCEESSILMVDESINQLRFELLTEENKIARLDKVGLDMGEGVAGKVWERGESIIINDTTKNQYISKKVDSQTKDITLSIIAVPLVVKGKIIGVMEAIKKKDGDHFSELDLEIFRCLSNQASIAIENAELFEAGVTDGMTKLFNHNYFTEKLHDEFNRSLRYGGDLSLIIFDIDHFKRFNDDYGHQLGDRVLITVAGIIRKHCRQNLDVPARYGGEEFALILPGTDKQGAIAFAERIRIEIESLAISVAEKIIGIQISGGVVTVPLVATADSFGMIAYADKALYYSKEHGRNRITFYSEDSAI